MALAVELYFDPETERSVVGLQQELHTADIEQSPDLAGSRPHITLSLVETDDDERLAEVVTEFAEDVSGCSVRLASLASFASSQGVLYLAPVPTHSLLRLHARLHEELLAAGLEAEPFYRPGAWIPHCTLALDLSGAELALAFEVCWPHFVPLEGVLVEAAVVAWPPPEPLHLIPLMDSKGPFG